jgi:hypothetical protein
MSMFKVSKRWEVKATQEGQGKLGMVGYLEYGLLLEEQQNGFAYTRPATSDEDFEEMGAALARMEADGYVFGFWAEAVLLESPDLMAYVVVLADSKTFSDLEWAEARPGALRPLGGKFAQLYAEASSERDKQLAQAEMERWLNSVKADGMVKSFRAL